jgi:quinol monooxygenase YgiN
MSALHRIARLSVDPSQLQEYKSHLVAQMSTAVRMEPGVLAYHAVFDKSDPSRITIFETYADIASYKAHLDTDHFRAYKAAVQHMVTSLELTDVDLLCSVAK